jgi:hypothetical protein
VAQRIIRELDRRTSTKWNEPRVALLKSAQECWIPHDELLNWLNALAGESLTVTDLGARMADMSPGPYSYRFADGEPDNRADCIRVYHREKSAGTAIDAMLQTIHDEVVWPNKEKACEQASQNRLENLRQVVASGKDCGFFKGLDDARKLDWHGRRGGQLYRLSRSGAVYELFAVDALGDEGKRTDPYQFKNMGAARQFLSRSHTAVEHERILSGL